MNARQLAILVGRAVNNVCLRDSELIRFDASEWAFAHRLAVYLEHEIPGWNIDCEYNRLGSDGDPKRDNRGTILRPDVIVHRRGHLDLSNNLLVIEVKKKEDRDDETKASAYTRKPEGNRTFQYQYGLSLSYFPQIVTHWFQNGKRIQPSHD